MSGQLEGKVALVTGGSSGIGRATALAFAREAAKVVIADVNVGGGEETVRMIAETGGEATFVEADVSRAADVEHMVEKAVETYGRLDCAFNNAGILGDGNAYTTAEYPEGVWDRVIAVNLKGVWLCMKHEIQQMVEQGGGSIVNTSSVLGLVGYPNASAYAASKHGIIGLTKVAALEYAQEHIRVNAVCPGYTLAPMLEAFDDAPEERERKGALLPMGRFGTPEEVAEGVLRLCSGAASFVAGHAMAIDGSFVAQ